ncbi:MAG TPA: hypothetical protein VG248_00930 [Caulobacteraceae bacterium]|jgi:hypothetical protein|nr:hypothetical protein [Caulobacteraceae bacterium]
MAINDWKSGTATELITAVNDFGLPFMQSMLALHDGLSFSLKNCRFGQSQRYTLPVALKIMGMDEEYSSYLEEIVPVLDPDIGSYYRTFIQELESWFLLHGDPMARGVTVSRI